LLIALAATFSPEDFVSTTGASSSSTSFADAAAVAAKVTSSLQSACSSGALSSALQSGSVSGVSSPCAFSTTVVVGHESPPTSVPTGTPHASPALPPKTFFTSTIFIGGAAAISALGIVAAGWFLWRRRWQINRAWRLTRKAAWGKASPARKRKTLSKIKPFSDNDDHDGVGMDSKGYDDEDIEDEHPTRPSTADGDHGPSLAERLELGTPRDILRLAFAHSRVGSISPMSEIGRLVSHVDDHRNDHHDVQRLVRELLSFSARDGSSDEDEEEVRPSRPGRGRSSGRIRPAELAPPSYDNNKKRAKRRVALL
jgi:hypothetical protein